DEPLLGLPAKCLPAPRMLFRPEEVHARSEKRRAAPRRPEAVVQVPDDGRGIDARELAIQHLDGERIAAVETGDVDAHPLAREEPGHRRGLEAALRKPFLL